MRDLGLQYMRMMYLTSTRRAHIANIHEPCTVPRTLTEATRPAPPLSSSTEGEKGCVCGMPRSVWGGRLEDLDDGCLLEARLLSLRCCHCLLAGV